jgi:hypothetical protein
MKWQSTAFVLLIGAVTAIAQSTPADKTPPETSDTKFNATRLHTGRFEYRIVRDGKQIATFTITVAKQSDGNFRFTAKGFDQEWESVATSSFQPISTALRIERPKRKEIYSMSLTYARDRVTGSAGTTADNTTNEAKLGEMKPVSAAVPAGTVDQRIDWAAMLASRLEVGQKLDFTVYDPATGVSKVAGEIGKAEQIRVPAGTFETIRAVYRIEKLKETETYEVLASKETPGFMVREDFSNGMSTELVKAVFH